MSLILLPRRNYTQPQGGVSASPNFDLAALWRFNDSTVATDLITGLETPLLQTNTFQEPDHIRIMARSVNIPGHSLQHRIGNFALTFVCVGQRLSTAGVGLYYGNSGSWTGIYCEPFSTWKSSRSNNFDGTIQSNSPLLDSSGFVSAAVARGGLNDFRASYGDGIVSDTTTQEPILSSPVLRLAGDRSGDNRSDIAIKMLAVIRGALTNAELQDLSANPWQLFKADPVRIYSLPPVLTIPSLSNPGVIDITATSARPQVTLTY